MGVVLALGIAAHGVLIGLLAPGLDPLWLSRRLSHALSAEGLNPRNGVTPGPVAVAGYAEPSLVFLLGTRTQLEGGPEAAKALADGRPAIVEQRVEPEFRAAAAALGLRPEAAAVVVGQNYSNGDDQRLVIYRPAR
jgi:hypothetical protein